MKASRRKQRAEADTAVSNDMSENYDTLFGSEDDESTQSYNPDRDEAVLKYRRGKHKLPTETSADDLRQDAENFAEVDPERAKLLKAAADEYDQMQKTPSRFECAVCGLGHSHSSTKHDIRDAFNVRREFADGMAYQPNCHCGVNELAMLLDFVEDIPMQMLEDCENEAVDEETIERVRSAADSAPIGAETRENIESRRAALEAEFGQLTFEEAVEEVVTDADWQDFYEGDQEDRQAIIEGVRDDALNLADDLSELHERPVTRAEASRDIVREHLVSRVENHFGEGWNSQSSEPQSGGETRWGPGADEVFPPNSPLHEGDDEGLDIEAAAAIVIKENPEVVGVWTSDANKSAAVSYLTDEAQALADGRVPYDLARQAVEDELQALDDDDEDDDDRTPSSGFGY